MEEGSAWMTLKLTHLPLFFSMYHRCMKSLRKRPQSSPRQAPIKVAIHIRACAARLKLSAGGATYCGMEKLMAITYVKNANMYVPVKRRICGRIAIDIRSL